MFTAEVILAAVLLVGPKDVDVPVERSAWLEALRPAILTLAMDAEILDPREKGFVLGHDVVFDLTMLRGRWHEMACAPSVAEVDRFPDRKFINELLALNRAYRNHLVERLAIDVYHEEALREAIADTDRLYLVWDTLRDSACEYYYVTVKRRSLQTLRDLIGPEAFYAGRLPPHIPVWTIPRQ